MKVSVFGLGYVGSVTAACLANENHSVLGVDVNPQKVAFVNEGKSPILEPGLDEILREAVEAGRLRATTDAGAAIRETECSLICVGTPSLSNGSLDLSQIHRVCQEIGSFLGEKSDPHVVVVRSTVLPGSVEGVLIPALEESSRKSVSDGFSVAVNPEFLREGESVHDFYHPSRVVIGASDAEAASKVGELYDFLSVPVVKTSLRTAEMIKYIDNGFHALKVSFANEIAEVCRKNGVDPYEAMRVFALDRQLNISTAYLRPGFAFGGSCLPKDLRAVLYKAGRDDLDLPLLSSILPSNEEHIQRAVEAVLRSGKKRVGVLGLAFKPGTDDLRESPIIKVIETLVGKGYEVSIHDEFVSLGRLHGSNKAYLEQQLPHVSSLMRDSVEETVGSAEVVVIASRRPAYAAIPERVREDQLLLDLVGINEPGLE